jgi:hypothetical protein
MTQRTTLRTGSAGARGLTGLLFFGILAIGGLEAQALPQGRPPHKAVAPALPDPDRSLAQQTNAAKTCTVPYHANSGNLPRPQLPVRITAGGQTIHTTALVDSGADDTVFPVSYAKALGIDLTSLPVTETRGVGTQHNITYHATVTLGIIFCGHEYSYRSAVAFIAGDSELLGQSGFLDHFRVTLDRTKKQFVIQSVDIQADAASQSPAEFERIDQRFQELEGALDRLIEIMTEEHHNL